MEEVINEVDLGWVAGFFQGEGSISLSVNGQGYFIGNIGAYQKEKEPLSLVQSYFGGKIRLKHNRGGFVEGGVDIWEWQLYGKSALPFLKAILPHVHSARMKEEISVYCKFFATADQLEKAKLLVWWKRRRRK